MAQRLHKVVRRNVYYAGGRDEYQGTPEVLYCGYDRLEAVRVYHANPPRGNGVPGSYGSQVIAKSKLIRESNEAREVPADG